jgi:hypothetical protein
MRDVMQDIRESWAIELVPGCYHFRDPELDNPSPKKAPVTPAPVAEENPEDLV